jgi:ubiquinone/menaquinone biosynthesis C-methylase UbiE
MLLSSIKFSQNKKYKDHLANTDVGFYSKYLYDIKKLKTLGGLKFLDCGCGTGNVLRNLDDKENNYGIDVSELFIDEVKKDGYKVSNYDGEHIPFPDSYFDIVGSFTVMEHVENPELFIEEQLRVLKKGGYLILACPNFLSVFNHVRSFSLMYKFKKLIGSYLKKSSDFNKMDPIIREDGEFQSDDDAIVETNPVQLRRYLRCKKVEIIEYSGFMSKRGMIYSVLSSTPFIRDIMPSCYFIVSKDDK